MVRGVGGVCRHAPTQPAGAGETALSRQRRERCLAGL